MLSELGTRIRTNFYILAFLIVVTTAVYVNGLSNPFVADDRHIIFVNFQPWKTWSVGSFFDRSLFSTGPSESTYFRPLTLLTFALNYYFSGENPVGYRAVNVALHLLVVALVFLLLSHLAENWVATFAALLFALHPVHVQAVSYISSRSDPLYTALALLVLLFWWTGTNAEENSRKFFLSSTLVVFFLGLFAKDTMITVFPLVVVMDLIWNRELSWQKEICEKLPWYGGLMVLFGIYLFIKTGFGFPLLMERGLEIGWGTRLLIALKLFYLYFGIVFYPVHLSLFRTVDVPQSFLELHVLLGSSLSVGMVVLVWLSWDSYKAISFGILWYLISILPVLNLTILNAPMMEHWLYLPLIGLTLAFVSAVRRLAERAGERRGAAIGLVLLALLLSARTVTRNHEWKDLIKVFSKDVITYPRSSRAWGWLASSLKAGGMLNEAIHAYKSSLAINPNQAEGWIGLGEALSFVGAEQEAEAALSRGLILQPNNSAFHYILGMHRLVVGKYDAAVLALERSVALNPGPMAYHALGSGYDRLGENNRASEAFAKAIALHPGEQKFHAEMHLHLARLYTHHGKGKEARQEWQLALRFDPTNIEARRLLEPQAR